MQIHEDAGDQFQVSVQLASVYRSLHHQMERALRDTLPVGGKSSNQLRLMYFRAKATSLQMGS